MTNSFVAYKGQPIYDWTGKEIWAFWAEKRVSPTPRIAFLTMGQLLGTDESRSTHVELTNDKGWIASSDCVQNDFRHNPLFVMNPLEGPQAMLHGLRALLEDTEFQTYMGTGYIGDMKTYEPRLEKRAKTPTW